MSEKEDNMKHDDLKNLVDGYELDLIIDALKITFGNQSRAAKLLGTSKRVISYKVHKYAINLADFKLKRLKSKRDVKKSATSVVTENQTYVCKFP